jgi:hypothetical protein
MVQKLGEEGVLLDRRSWSIYPGYLEIPLMIRVNEVHMGGEAVIGYDHVRKLHHGIVPEKENAPLSPNGRPLGEALQTVAADVNGVRGRNRVKLGFLQAHNLTRRGSNYLMHGVPTILVI